MFVARSGSIARSARLVPTGNDGGRPGACSAARGAHEGGDSQPVGVNEPCTAGPRSNSQANRVSWSSPQIDTPRIGARVLLLDEHDRVLLMHARDPDDPAITGGSCPGAALMTENRWSRRLCVRSSKKPASNWSNSDHRCGSQNRGSAIATATTTVSTTSSSLALSTPQPPLPRNPRTTRNWGSSNAHGSRPSNCVSAPTSCCLPHSRPTRDPSHRRHT
jgi:hypothetical protein